MNTKKGVAQSMAVIFGIILLLLMVLISTSIFTDFFEKTKSHTNIFLEDNFNFLQDIVSEEEDLKEQFPDGYLEYAQKLIPDLFEATSFKKEERGEIYFVDAFKAGIANPEDYEQFHLMLSYTQKGSVFGVSAMIYNSRTKEVFPLFNPKDDDFLSGKKICILPVLDESPDIRSALLYAVMGKIEDVPMLPRDIINKGNVERLTLGFGQDDSMHAVSPDRSQVIFKYDEDDSKVGTQIPIYVYGNTVCFLGVSTGDKGVRLEIGGNGDKRLSGYGPLWWSTLVELNNIKNK